MPAECTPDGFPVGLQIIGRHLADSSGLRASAAFEHPFLGHPAGLPERSWGKWNGSGVSWRSSLAMCSGRCHVVISGVGASVTCGA
ncbi:hypothetical protein [Streptomyces sp. 049-1]|uniref:hypothetical protein n=1 Tax=Streptomyces sp. 049-1 TaxID=2789264 RepID=UPI00397F0FC9